MSSRVSWHAIQDCYPTCPSHPTVLISSHSPLILQDKARLGHQSQMDTGMQCWVPGTFAHGRSFCSTALKKAREPWRKVQGGHHFASALHAIPGFCSFSGLLLPRWNHQMLGEFDHLEAWRRDDALEDLEGCAGPDELLGMLPKACLRLHIVLNSSNSKTAWSLTQNMRIMGHEWFEKKHSSIIIQASVFRFHFSFEVRRVTSLWPNFSFPSARHEARRNPNETSTSSRSWSRSARFEGDRGLSPTVSFSFVHMGVSKSKISRGMVYNGKPY